MRRYTPEPRRPNDLAVAAVAVFPLWSVVDLAMNGGHNLLPFEWMFYGFYAGLVFLGILAGRSGQRVFIRSRHADGRIE